MYSSLKGEKINLACVKILLHYKSTGIFCCL